MHKIPHEDPREVMALFRYAMVAPLIDPLSTPQERTAWRRQVVAQIHRLPDGRQIRVGERTLRQWVARYRQGGFTALRLRARCDRGGSRTLTTEQLATAKALKREEPARSVPHILRMMQVPDTAVHRSTLWRQLAKDGLGRRERAAKSSLRRWQAEKPLDLWQADAKHGPFLPEPGYPDRMRRTYLLACIDDRTRMLMHGEFFWAEDLYALELCMEKAFLHYGLPFRLYVDQGMIFKANVFTRACAELQVHHILATPQHPEGKGKIERLFRTVEDDFLIELRHAPLSSLQQLNAQFTAWVEEVYHVRPHRELGEPPLQCWQRLLPVETVRRVEPARLRQIFLWRVTRKVDKTCVVSFAGNRYQTPAGLERRKVELRFHPLRLDSLQVWLDDVYLGQAEPLQLVSNTYGDVAQAHVQVDKAPCLPYLEMLLAQRETRQRRALSPLQLAAPEVKPDV